MSIVAMLQYLDRDIHEAGLRDASDADLSRAMVLAESILKQVFAEGLRRDPNLSHPAIHIELDAVRNLTARDMELLIKRVKDYIRRNDIDLLD